MTKTQLAEQEEWRAKLRATLKPGDTITTVLRHVSKSGMSRVIDCYHLKCVKGKVVRDRLSYWIAKAGIGTFNNKPEGVRVGGCGMDMGFHIVYTLGQVLWPKGTAKPHGVRNGQPDNDGGYALKQEWL